MADVSVRLANVQDASGITAVQAASWRDALAGTLPPAVLDQLLGAEAVGFAAIGPAGDPDSDGQTHAELLAIGAVVIDQLRLDATIGEPA